MPMPMAGSTAHAWSGSRPGSPPTRNTAPKSSNGVPSRPRCIVPTTGCSTNRCRRPAQGAATGTGGLPAGRWPPAGRRRRRGGAVHVRECREETPHPVGAPRSTEGRRRRLPLRPGERNRRLLLDRQPLWLCAVGQYRARSDAGPGQPGVPAARRLIASVELLIASQQLQSKIVTFALGASSHDHG